MSVNIFTQKGLEDIKNKLEKLEKERPDTVIALKTAREMGDLSENAAYHVARSRLTSIDSRIRKLKYLIKTSKVLPKFATNTIQIDTKVTLNHNGKVIIYTIVGSYESDPSKGKISYISPLGQLLIGKKVGENVILPLPNNPQEYTVLNIE
jgi:transcription elongation factor GreA